MRPFDYKINLTKQTSLPISQLPKYLPGAFLKQRKQWPAPLKAYSEKKTTGKQLKWGEGERGMYKVLDGYIHIYT